MTKRVILYLSCIGVVALIAVIWLESEVGIGIVLVWLLSLYFFNTETKPLTWAVFIVSTVVVLLFLDGTNYFGLLLIFGVYHIVRTGTLLNWKRLIFLMLAISVPLVLVDLNQFSYLLLVGVYVFCNYKKEFTYFVLVVGLIAVGFTTDYSDVKGILLSLFFILGQLSLLFDRLPFWVVIVSLFGIIGLGASKINFQNSLKHQLWDKEFLDTQSEKNKEDETEKVDALRELNAYQDSIELIGLYHEDRILGNSMIHVDDWNRKIPNSMLILWHYLKNFFAPFQLRYYYGYNQIPLTNWGDYRVYLSFLIHAIMVFCGFFFFKRKRLLAFSCLFYLLTIVLYSHFLLKLPDTMADRFLFTPSLGLCLLTVILLDEVFRTGLMAPPAVKKKKKKRKKVS